MGGPAATGYIATGTGGAGFGRGVGAVQREWPLPPPVYRTLGPTLLGAPPDATDKAVQAAQQAELRRQLSGQGRSALFNPQRPALPAPIAPVKTLLGGG